MVLTNFNKILNKRVIALKGLKYAYKDSVEVLWILFDDGETFISLTEQDKYDFHDCSNSARQISIGVDEERWKDLMNEADATNDNFVW